MFASRRIFLRRPFGTGLFPCIGIVTSFTKSGCLKFACDPSFIRTNDHPRQFNSLCSSLGVSCFKAEPPRPLRDRTSRSRNRSALRYETEAPSEGPFGLLQAYLRTCSIRETQGTLPNTDRPHGVLSPCNCTCRTFRISYETIHCCCRALFLRTASELASKSAVRKGLLEGLQCRIEPRIEILPNLNAIRPSALWRVPKPCRADSHFRPPFRSPDIIAKLNGPFQYAYSVSK